MVELAEGAPGVGVHAVHERVDRLDLREQLAVVQVREHGPRLHQVLVDARELVAALDQRRRRAAQQAVELVIPAPPVTAAIGRSGATSGTLEKSNGLATSAAEATGSPRRRPARAARGSRPGTSRPAARGGRRRPPTRRGSRSARRRRSSARGRGRGRRTRSRRSRRGRSGGRASTRCSATRAAAPQVEADRRRGQRRHQQHGQRAAAARRGRLGRVVALTRALRPLVDHRRGHPPQVGEPLAEHAVVEVGGRVRERPGRQRDHAGPATPRRAALDPCAMKSCGRVSSVASIAPTKARIAA